MAAAKQKAKAPTIVVPQSDEMANALLAQYGDAFNALAHLQADTNEALARIKALHEADAKPLQELLSTIFEQLSAWSAAHRDRLTEKGKSKTVQLPAGAIGWRQRPPSVRWKKGFKVEDIVAALKEHGLRRFLRIKSEPNKERMLEEPDVAGKVPGILIGSGGEDFFVAPFGAELAEPRS